MEVWRVLWVLGAGWERRRAACRRLSSLQNHL